ncbi:MAG: SUMF1/EgtB/PvdO family nonheme iron enzyme [Candidatus Omnitrophica bacterium]|nr:SUMF1/EgtB/PvdO family nonheme iron enzyme [Candidatus Omnitrophota bacterium]
MKILLCCSSIICILIVSPFSFANNLTLDNPSLTDSDTEGKTTKITFDISWDNSWRNKLNYDAAWIFVKYSIDSGSTWQHATLKSAGVNPTGFSLGSGTAIEIVVPQDKKGCFIQRAAYGGGSLATTGVALVWDWGADGLDSGTQARVKIAGIEMVYIPEEAFYLGDGDGSSESTYAFHQSGNDNSRVQITSASKNITCDINGNDDIDTLPVTVDGDGGIAGNANFPTGYKAFYIMKYEISESQWVDFFNTLSYAKQLARDITDTSGKNSDEPINRNTVSWTSGAATTVAPDRSCGYLSWMDLCAYADWTALRPMTELEYEKAARGSMDAVFAEYAWGNNNVTYATTISGAEDGTETITDNDANCCANNQTFSGGSGGTGPLRNGIFAVSNSSRQEAGSTYYGAMEFSGNLAERVVTLGNESGRDFQGTNGDGILSQAESFEGNATNTDWPGIDGTPARGVTGALGSGSRGGAWNSLTNPVLRISDRTSASAADSARREYYGGRCVRTAP